MNESDLIWNRACYDGGANPRAGDRALAALLYVHGNIMNGGVLHAMECLTESELSDAIAGYRFFSFDAVAELLPRARRLYKADQNHEIDDSEAEELYDKFDAEYAVSIPDDSAIEVRFLEHLKTTPSDFAPVSPQG